MKQLILLLMLCISLSIKSQTFYEVCFTDEDTEYVGLFIYYSDDDCKVRLVTAEQLENNEVSESEYQQRIAPKENKDDIGLMFYEPEIEGFPYFIWSWESDDASDISEAPYVAFNVDDEKTWVEAEYFEEITLRDMDEEYISQFYGEDEEEYKMMMAGINKIHSQRDFGGYGDETRWHNRQNRNEGNVSEYGHREHGNHNGEHRHHWRNGEHQHGQYHNNIRNNEDNVDVETSTDLNNNIDPNSFTNTNGSTLSIDEPTTTVPQQPCTLHLIIAANTKVSDIGVACKVDLDNLRSEFKGIAKVLEMQYDEQLVSDDNYSKQSLAKIVTNLKPDANDIVVFAYSGHGFRFQDQTDYYPNIDLSTSSYEDYTKTYVALSDIYSALKEKGARLTIVMSDCCNSVSMVNTPIINSNTLFSRSNNNFDLDRLQTLFLKSEGTLLATAASPGEYSWCTTNGGYFISSIIESLRNQISLLNSSEPSWETLFSDAIDAAAKKSDSKSHPKQNGLKQVQIKSAK